MTLTRWQRFRRAWVMTGATVGVIFIAWSLLAYRASGGAYAALENTETVTVEPRGVLAVRAEGVSRGRIAVLSGSARRSRGVCAAGESRRRARLQRRAHPVPRRGAMGGAESAELAARYMRAMRETETSGGPRRWIVAGHSRGGVISSNVVRSQSEGIAGLVLVGHVPSARFQPDAPADSGDAGVWDARYRRRR